MDEVNKIFSGYISTHNKKFDFYVINCEFVIEFGNNFIAKIKTKYFYNTDFINIKRYLLYDIDCFKSRRHKFYNINQMTMNINSDMCNMTNEYYINQRMSMCERNINMIIANNPDLINSLDRNKKHPLVRKFLHIPFIN